jgi:hypothetical protein
LVHRSGSWKLKMEEMHHVRICNAREREREREKPGE